MMSPTIVVKTGQVVKLPSSTGSPGAAAFVIRPEL